MSPPGGGTLITDAIGRESHASVRTIARRTWAPAAACRAAPFNSDGSFLPLRHREDPLTPDVRNLLRHVRAPGLAYRDFAAAAPAPVRRTERREGLTTIGLVSLVPGVGRTALCANLLA